MFKVAIHRIVEVCSEARSEVNARTHSSAHATTQRRRRRNVVAAAATTTKRTKY